MTGSGNTYHLQMDIHVYSVTSRVHWEYTSVNMVDCGQSSPRLHANLMITSNGLRSQGRGVVGVGEIYCWFYHKFVFSFEIMHFKGFPTLLANQLTRVLARLRRFAKQSCSWKLRARGSRAFGQRDRTLDSRLIQTNQKKILFPLWLCACAQIQ